MTMTRLEAECVLAAAMLSPKGFSDEQREALTAHLYEYAKSGVLTFTYDDDDEDVTATGFNFTWEGGMQRSGRPADH
jgi:hypothetical protein